MQSNFSANYYRGQVNSFSKESLKESQVQDQDLIVPAEVVTKNVGNLGEVNTDYMQQILARDIRLRDVPKSKITRELCFASIKVRPESIHDVPESFVDQELWNYLIDNSNYVYTTIPDKFLTVELIQNGLMKVDNMLEVLPKGIQHCFKIDFLSIIERSPRMFDFIDQSLKTPELSKRAVELRGVSFAFVPEKQKTQELCRLAINKNFDAFSYFPDNLKHDEGFVHDLYRDKLIRWSDIPKELQLGFERIFKRSPLTFENDDVLAESGIYQNGNMLISQLAGCEMPYGSDMRDAFSKINTKCENIEKSSRGVRDIFGVSSKIKLEHGQLMGGRTLKLKKNHYKFWKDGESLSDFIKESKTVEYLYKNKKSLGLKSEIPQPKDIKLVPVTPSLIEQVNDFTDFPKIITDPNTKESFFLVYHYKASDDYGVFTHQPESNSKEPYKKAHEGMLKGIFDIGRMARNGVLYTNTLPAYHNQDQNRRWILTVEAFTNQMSPGTLRSWCEEATNFPDYGYSGLRDYGDFSLVGDPSDYLERDPIRRNFEDKNRFATTQKLTLYNCINENIVAVLLLYARLHRESKEYHHNSDKAISETSGFIEDVLNSFLKGYLEADAIDARQLLGLPKDIYETWLKITSQRLIYWTEKQSPEIDCYTTHFMKNQCFHPDIYPCVPKNTSDVRVDAVKGFVNNDGKADLGGHNRIFPLMNLAEGLALMSLSLEKLENK